MTTWPLQPPVPCPHGRLEDRACWRPSRGSPQLHVGAHGVRSRDLAPAGASPWVWPRG